MQSDRKRDTTDNQSDSDGESRLYLQVAAFVPPAAEPTKSFTARFERPNPHLAQ